MLLQMWYRFHFQNVPSNLKQWFFLNASFTKCSFYNFHARNSSWVWTKLHRYQKPSKTHSYLQWNSLLGLLLQTLSLLAPDPPRKKEKKIVYYILILKYFSCAPNILTDRAKCIHHHHKSDLSLSFHSKEARIQWKHKQP